MKLYNILAILFVALIFNSCDKLEWDLKRDNPLDNSKNSTSNNDTTHVNTSKGVVFSRFKVYSDNNNDGNVNKGESIKLLLYLKNNTENTVNKVRASVTTKSSYVKNLAPTTLLSFDNDGYSDYISANEEKYSYNTSYSGYSISFDVLNTTPVGTILTFYLSISDGSGHNWKDSCNITVTAIGANIEFSRYSVYSDNNNDDNINKGESIKLLLYLKNSGTSTANKVRATVTTTSSYVTNLAPSTQLRFDNDGYSDNIASNSEKYSYNTSYSGYSISFDVSQSTPIGTVITFNLAISDEAGNTWSSSFTITVVATGAYIEFSRYSVYSDNNNDDNINKGESIKLLVYLKNTGTSTANKVRATITTNSSYITNLAPTTQLKFDNDGYSDNITANGEKYSYNTSYSGYSISFDVSQSAPIGTVITFNLAISDEAGNTWSSSFTTTVVATGANIQFSRYSVYSDNNNDDIINKGESIKLLVYLKNTGTSTANKVRATVTTSSSYISSLAPVTQLKFDNDGYSDYISSNAEKYSYNTSYSGYSISFNVSNSTPTGTIITFKIAISDESNNTWTSSFNITVN